MKEYESMEDEVLTGNPEHFTNENYIREIGENSGFKSNSDNEDEEHETIESVGKPVIS